MAKKNLTAEDVKDLTERSQDVAALAKLANDLIVKLHMDDIPDALASSRSLVASARTILEAALSLHILHDLQEGQRRIDRATDAKAEAEERDAKR